MLNADNKLPKMFLNSNIEIHKFSDLFKKNWHNQILNSNIEIHKLYNSYGCNNKGKNFKF